MTKLEYLELRLKIINSTLTKVIRTHIALGDDIFLLQCEKEAIEDAINK